MEKNVIKSLIIEYQQFTEKITLTERDIHLSDQLNYVFVGLRRAGKSYLMYQQIQHLLKEGHQIEEILYFNFEDDRLINLTIEDLDLIKVCYEELYAHRPIFFLDEVQIVVEGVYSARAARILAEKYGIDMPIVNEVNKVLFENKTAREAMADLMLRDKKIEHPELPWKK